METNNSIDRQSVRQESNLQAPISTIKNTAIKMGHSFTRSAKSIKNAVLDHMTQSSTSSSVDSIRASLKSPQRFANICQTIYTKIFHSEKKQFDKGSLTLNNQSNNTHIDNFFETPAIELQSKATMMKDSIITLKNELTKENIGFFKLNDEGNLVPTEKFLAQKDTWMKEYASIKETAEVDVTTYMNNKFDEEMPKFKELAEKLKTDDNESNIAFSSSHKGGKAHCVDYGVCIPSTGMACIGDAPGHNADPDKMFRYCEKQSNLFSTYEKEIQDFQKITNPTNKNVESLVRAMSRAMPENDPQAISQEFRHGNERHLAYAVSGDAGILIYNKKSDRLELIKNSKGADSNQPEIGSRKLSKGDIVINTTDGVFNFISDSKEDEKILKSMIKTASNNKTPALSLINDIKNGIQAHLFGKDVTDTNAKSAKNIFEKNADKFDGFKKCDIKNQSYYDDLSLTLMQSSDVRNPLIVKKIV